MAATPETPQEPKEDPEAYFQHYWSYATQWRNWVVGTAVGALFILLNKEVGGRFEWRALIATLFVAAAGAQVILAFINKTAAFYQYRELKGDQSRWCKFWVGVLDCYWLDFVCDLLSILLVVAAVVVMLHDILGVRATAATQPMG